MQVRYVGRYDAVEIAATSQEVKNGETVEVPDEVGGKEPTSKHHGEGLLAQPDNWVPVDSKSKKGTE